MADHAPATTDLVRPAPSQLAALVRGWRERALMTQEQLALRAGLGVRTIRRLESGGSTRPRDCSVSLLADALHLPVEDRARFVAAVRA
jgi:transcriptional regulator with XRE-family HTH domain